MRTRLAALVLSILLLAPAAGASPKAKGPGGPKVGVPVGPPPPPSPKQPPPPPMRLPDLNPSDLFPANAPGNQPAGAAADDEEEEEDDGDLGHLFDEPDNQAEIDAVEAAIGDASALIDAFGDDVDELVAAYLASPEGRHVGALVEALEANLATLVAESAETKQDAIDNIPKNTPPRPRRAEVNVAEEEHRRRVAELTAQHEQTLDALLRLQMAATGPAFFQEYTDLQSDLADFEAERGRLRSLLNDLESGD